MGDSVLALEVAVGQAHGAPLELQVVEVVERAAATAEHAEAGPCRANAFVLNPNADEAFGLPHEVVAVAEVPVRVVGRNVGDGRMVRRRSWSRRVDDLHALRLLGLAYDGHG